MIEVESEVTGKVWRIDAAVGDAVSAGDTLLVLESMKMEIPVLAPASGRLAALLVGQDDAVDEDQVLATIDPA